ncbi:hypothetical protein RHMOL_Rhmol01G0116300 [Rhododendron molle]|uniref:Uncharacterized protein n=1 Tax=Rhododendron molle TaxID=49168 RepID=A0ACC0Q3D8_RHOML|nr:hypothetical protein RHMOL_Rhmol01G0116300 [Rhododendron molle]
MTRRHQSSTAESSSYAPPPYTAVPLPLSSLDLNLAYLGGGGCCGGVGFTGFITTATSCCAPRPCTTTSTCTDSIERCPSELGRGVHRKEREIT